MISIIGNNNEEFKVEELCDLRVDTFEELEDGFEDTNIEFNELKAYYEDYSKKNSFRKLIKVTRKKEVPVVDYRTMLGYIFEKSYYGVVRDVCKLLYGYTEDNIKAYLSNTKGTRLGDMKNTLIKWLNSFSSFDVVNSNKLIDVVTEMFNEEEISYYLIDNSLSGILGASYSYNYSSCYNARGGQYNASLDYILSENLKSDDTHWYNIYHIKEENINKIIEEKYIDLETLYNVKLGRKTLVCDNDNTFVIGKTYGFMKNIYEGDLLKIVAKIINQNIKLEEMELDRDSDVYYDYEQGGYKDLECGNMLLSNHNSGIGYVWKFDEIRLFNHKWTCPHCGEEHDSEEENCVELYNRDYACTSCAFQCEDCGEWHLLDEDHYRIGGCLYCENCVERE